MGRLRLRRERRRLEHRRGKLELRHRRGGRGERLGRRGRRFGGRLGRGRRSAAEERARRVGGEGRLARRLERDQPVHQADQLADVPDAELGGGLEHPEAHLDAPLLGLALQDGEPRLGVGGGDVHEEAAREPRDEPLVQIVDLGRRPVGGEDDLAPRGLEGLRDPQQLGLHLGALGEELDVVEEEDVHLLHRAAEGVALARGHRGMVLLDELLERDVLDAEVRLLRQRLEADRLQQMGLPQP